MTWQTIISLLWLVAVLILLVLIWRSSEKRVKHTHSMELLLAGSVERQATSTQQAVEALCDLVAILKEQKNDELQ